MYSWDVRSSIKQYNIIDHRYPSTAYLDSQLRIENILSIVILEIYIYICKDSFKNTEEVKED